MTSYSDNEEALHTEVNGIKDAYSKLKDLPLCETVAINQVGAEQFLKKLPSALLIVR